MFCLFSYLNVIHLFFDSCFIFIIIINNCFLFWFWFRFCFISILTKYILILYLFGCRSKRKIIDLHRSLVYCLHTYAIVIRGLATGKKQNAHYVSKDFGERKTQEKHRLKTASY